MEKLLNLCMAGVVCMGMATDGAFTDKPQKRGSSQTQTELS